MGFWYCENPELDFICDVWSEVMTQLVRVSPTSLFRAEWHSFDSRPTPLHFISSIYWMSSLSYSMYYFYTQVFHRLSYGGGHNWKEE